MRYFLILFLICSVMIFPGEEEKSKLVVKQLMPETQKEEEPTADPTGKRDPFMNLLLNAQNKVDKLENWPIDDMNLEGIIKLKNGQFRALLVSPKGKAFFASVGQKLHDGEIAEITIEKVVFKKIPLVSLPK
jgi:Tfp pilus assembly protein PilP